VAGGQGRQVAESVAMANAELMRETIPLCNVCANSFPTQDTKSKNGGITDDGQVVGTSLACDWPWVIDRRLRLIEFRIPGSCGGMAIAMLACWPILRGPRSDNGYPGWCPHIYSLQRFLSGCRDGLVVHGDPWAMGARFPRGGAPMLGLCTDTHYGEHIHPSKRGGWAHQKAIWVATSTSSCGPWPVTPRAPTEHPCTP
jgi:hypothetical protein